MRAVKCFASSALAFSALTTSISGWAKLPGPARPDQRPSNPSSRQADLAWWGGGNRFFVGARTDFGYLFLRPRLSAGYGRPHHTWVGADLNPTVSRHAAGGYFGGRLAHPNIDIRAGARCGYAYSRRFLQQRDSYDHLDLQALDGPRARYLSWESELSYSIPLAGGHVIGELAGTIVTFVSPGYYVFEDTLNVVVAPPHVLRKRVGYSWAFGLEDAFQLGVVAEVVSVPRRSAWIYRAGLVASVTLSGSLALRAVAIPVISSPDSIGAEGSDFFLLGIRHYWATGP